MPIVESYRYTRADIQSHPEWLFVFGDNLQRVGLGGQAKEARGEPNAVGVPTKQAPYAFLRDADLRVVVPTWREAFSRINQHLLGGGTVIWPSDGIGTGRAELERRAPILWNELQLFIAGMKSTAEACGQWGFGSALGGP